MESGAKDGFHGGQCVEYGCGAQEEEGNNVILETAPAKNSPAHSFRSIKKRLSDWSGRHFFKDIWPSLTMQQPAVPKTNKQYFVCQSARGFGLNGSITWSVQILMNVHITLPEGIVTIVWRIL